ncbi:MAG: hypothetical protein CMN76_10925 [Spirochaetaceae bacterium]|nr:hypothetical protein [Spirochaetaceae bacterium]
MTILPVLLTALAFGCKSNEYTSLSDLLSRHPANRLENWQTQFQQRQGQWPQDFVQSGKGLPLEYARDMNLMDGYPPPRPARLAPWQLAEYRSSLLLALESKPELRNFLTRRVAGIYLVEDLGSSGLTGFIYDSEGVARAGFILLDIHRVELRASEMINLREKTLIKNAEELPADWGYRLQCNYDCDAPGSALNLLLFHESAHVASEVYRLLPSLLVSRKEYEASSASLPEPWNHYWSSPWETRPFGEVRPILQFYGDRPDSTSDKHQEGVRDSFKQGFPGTYSLLDVWEHMAEVTAYGMSDTVLVFSDGKGHSYSISVSDRPDYAAFLRDLQKRMGEDSGIGEVKP